MPARDTLEAPVLSVDIHWYCVKTQPKRESIAYGALAALPDIEAFFPRVRYQRTLARGPRTVVEALFPGYLFVRFAPARRIRAVRYARGVSYIVRQGREFAPVPEEIIRALRALATTQVMDFPRGVGQGGGVGAGAAAGADFARAARPGKPRRISARGVGAAPYPSVAGGRVMNFYFHYFSAPSCAPWVRGANFLFPPPARPTAAGGTG
jgi:hypothetical protein